MVADLVACHIRPKILILRCSRSEPRRTQNSNDTKRFKKNNGCMIVVRPSRLASGSHLRMRSRGDLHGVIQ